MIEPPRMTGKAGWEAILPARAPAPRLEGARTTDWLVIGAGFAGLAAARRLRQLHPTDRIVVLEAHRIGEGPIGRNSGFMIDLPHVLASKSYASTEAADRAQIDANRAAIGFARSAVEDYGIAPEAFDACGKVNGAMTEDGTSLNVEYAAHLTNLGEKHEVLDAQQMAELTGTNAYVSGLYTPGTVLLQPALLAREMVAGLASEVVDVYENSPVEDLARNGQTWTAKTKNGSIRAPKVILAVNGQIEKFGFFKNRLLHVVLFASITKPLSASDQKALGGIANWGITPSDPMGSSVRKITSSDGTRLLIRNRAQYDPKLRGSDAKLASLTKSHEHALARRFSNLADLEIDHSWGGALCLSQNASPAFGEIETGLFAAACQNGLGSVHGTYSGMLAADLASGETSAELNDHISRPTPTRLPPFSNIGAPLVLAYKDWRGRKER